MEFIYGCLVWIGGHIWIVAAYLLGAFLLATFVGHMMSIGKRDDE